MKTLGVLAVREAQLKMPRVESLIGPRLRSNLLGVLLASERPLWSTVV
jgi:hypothetical protein